MAFLFPAIGTALVGTAATTGVAAGAGAATSTAILTGTAATSGLIGAGGAVTAGGLFGAASAAAGIGSGIAAFQAGEAQAKSIEIQQDQERKRAEIESLSNRQRILSVINSNRASAAGRGVVGGSGSEAALESANLRGFDIDAGTISGNTRMQQAIFAQARRSARTRGVAGAARSLFDVAGMAL